MHILATSSATLDDLVEPVDLRQAPAEMVALSFTDSDLAAIAAAWKRGRDELPELRLASLRDLRHPMSVDLWLDRVATHARVILVRILGGYDWWRYGCDRLAALARERGLALVLLPGNSVQRDDRLADLSTVDPETYETLTACFREGGPDNMGHLVRHMARLSGHNIAVDAVRPLEQCGFYAPGKGTVPLAHFLAAAEGQAVVPVLFYRSMLLADDVAPIDALAETLSEQDILAVPIFLTSLRDDKALRLLSEAAEALQPAALVTATAFAMGPDAEEELVFDRLGLPVFQVAIATTRREAWIEGQRGLAPADLAMHVVLPELDGRIMAGAISFKDAKEPDPALSVALQVNRPEPDRVSQVATRIAAFLRLQTTPLEERRVLVILPDYPAATGRSGYAVGLDVPQSVIEMLRDLAAEGYDVADIPDTPRELMRLLEREVGELQLADYAAAFAALPEGARKAVEETWGGAEKEAGEGAFRFRATNFGKITVAFAPERGRQEDRRAEYHDPSLPPRHGLIAFGVWLREVLGCHAIAHVGAHGTLEWLPGKTVALSQNCFPEIVTGALPVIYPFIVSNPGEAAQAKRRIGAVTLGHLTPPLVGAGLSDEQRALEQLVDEYAQADGLDRRRRDRLAALIVEKARETGLAGEAGVGEDDNPEAALLRIDAWLCDLKDFAIKDGLHIYGRASADERDPQRIASATAERDALLAALSGRRVRPGPSGAPSRGRTDVLPTGRNLFTSDPRTLPTPTAVELGKAAAEEVVRIYLQEHGEYPRSLVMDLWGSASLRTGGEEIAQGLALMGCRPQWDPATARVTGIEVLPPAAIGRPRIDVTWRISGLFRDMFPTQIALIDAAVSAVAARDEADDDNPLAAARRAGEKPLRIFGSAPGTYGSGIEERLASGDWDDRTQLGQVYLDAASHAFGGAEGTGKQASGAFAARVAEADLLVHAGDDPGRDLLEGSADVAFVGGFSAALAALGGKADLVMLDTTDPARPRAHSLAAAVTRVVRARVLNPRFIEGQLRHGPRGAAEFAETVDRLVGFAETTEAIAGELIENVYYAYLEDECVRDFLLRENPAALRAMAERFLDARRRNLWHPRRNAVDNSLAELIEEARGEEAAA